MLTLLSSTSSSTVESTPSHSSPPSPPTVAAVKGEEKEKEKVVVVVEEKTPSSSSSSPLAFTTTTTTSLLNVQQQQPHHQQPNKLLTQAAVSPPPSIVSTEPFHHSSPPSSPVNNRNNNINRNKEGRPSPPPPLHHPRQLSATPLPSSSSLPASSMNGMLNDDNSQSNESNAMIMLPKYTFTILKSQRGNRYQLVEGGFVYSGHNSNVKEYRRVNALNEVEDGDDVPEKRVIIKSYKDTKPHQHEMSIYTLLSSCKNTIRPIDFIYYNRLALVFEKYEPITSISEQLKYYMFYENFLGILFNIILNMHKRGVIHADIAERNIVIDMNTPHCPIVIDFDVSVCMNVNEPYFNYQQRFSYNSDGSVYNYIDGGHLLSYHIIPDYDFKAFLLLCNRIIFVNRGLRSYDFGDKLRRDESVMSTITSNKKHKNLLNPSSTKKIMRDMFEVARSQIVYHNNDDKDNKDKDNNDKDNIKDNNDNNDN